MFDYIEENLRQIKNPNDVKMIYITKDKRGIYPAVCIRGDLEPVRLAKSQIWIAPFSPISYLSNTMGHFYWEGFVTIGDVMAINTNNVLSMAYVVGNKNVDIYANFNDGDTLFLANPSKKRFYSKIKAQIENRMQMKLEDITEKVKLENYKIITSK